MNSRKFDFFGYFATCFRLFNLTRAIIILLTIVLYPSWAAATYTVTLQLESVDSDIIAGHKIFYREENQQYNFSTPAWEGQGTLCTLSGLEEDVTYYFVARTFDINGNTSDNSNEIKFRQDSTPLPKTPDQPNNSATETDPDSTVGLNPKQGPILTAEALDATGLEEGQLTSTQWRIYREADNLCVFDATVTPATNQIQIPRLVLEKDTPYIYTARYIGVSDKTLEWTPKQNFIDTNIMAEDADTNGIPDEQEADAQVDTDENGTPDILQKNMYSIRSATREEEHIGLSLEKGHNVVSIEAVETIDLSELPISEDVSVAPEMPLGLINIRLLVRVPGDQAQITIHLPDIEESTEAGWGYLWYRYDAIHGWKDASESISNDGKTKTLKLTDGGEGDVDGVKNGIIVTQSGPANTPAQGIGGGGSSRACFINSLF